MQQGNQQEKRSRLSSLYMANPNLSLEENFLLTMSPGLQRECASNPARCYLGDAPSLAELRLACSEDFAASWLMLQLNSVAESVSDKDSISADSIRNSSYDILNNYAWLKTSEIMLFCSRVRAGIYGKLAYGSITMDDITSKLALFVRARETEISAIERAIERERKQAEYDSMRRNAVTKEEAYRIINAAADGDEEARHRLRDDPENWRNRVYRIEWTVDDRDRIRIISSYFGIHVDICTGDIVACFENSRYAKFLEGEQKGYYKIKQ